MHLELLELLELLKLLEPLEPLEPLELLERYHHLNLAKLQLYRLRLTERTNYYQAFV
jgi:hypothetical protein